MSDTIITKRCCHCKQTKFLNEFYRNKSSKDGHHKICKVCHKAYQQSEKGKKHKRKYRKTKKGQFVEKAYQQSKVGKVVALRSVKNYQKRFPERKKAGNAVNHAIRDGKLPRPDTLRCYCGNQAKHYHHHKGYAKEHWLDVVPVCVKCHIKIPNGSRRTQTHENINQEIP